MFNSPQKGGRILTYLLDGLKVVFHALDGDVFASLDALGLEHL